MKTTTQNDLNYQQKSILLELWNSEYPAEIAYPDMAAFEAYLQKLDQVSHYIVTDDSGAICGWYFQFIRENEPWFGIVLSQSSQGKGVGSGLLNMAKETAASLSGWVIDSDRFKKQDGQPYRSPIDFYRKNGFEVRKNVRLETALISAVKIRWDKKTEPAGPEADGQPSTE